MIFWITVKKKTLSQKRVKKIKINAKLEYHIIRPHLLPHEVFALYIYIYTHTHTLVANPCDIRDSWLNNNYK